MLCGKCGADNPEGSAVCGSCGADLTAGGKPFGDKNKTAGLLIIIGGAVLALALLVFLFNLIFGSGAKGNALKYLKAQDKKNGAGTLISLTIPSKIMDDQLEARGYDKKSEWIADRNDQLEENWEDRKDNKTKHSYKVVDVISMKDYDEDRLDQIKESFEDEYDLKVSNAKMVFVYCKTTNEDGKTGGLRALEMVKIGMKWYVNTLV